ncbi:MAG: hypothetical protein AB8H79_26425 [Myxococcota bacterium]
MLLLLSQLVQPATAAESDLELHVEPVMVPATSQVPLDTLLWVNLEHRLGPAGAVAEILGDDFSRCDDLRSVHGFRPRHAKELWADGLLRHAVVEVTRDGVYVGGTLVVTLEGGKTPDRLKEGVVLRPVLDALLRQREAQYQFRMACEDEAWAPGVLTSASSESLLVAVAPDMPFDVVHEVLVSARKARFKRFYLYAKSRRFAPDPQAAPPTLGNTKMRVFVASDGGLGIDPQEEGLDAPSAVVSYLPSPAGTRTSTAIPYPSSPFSAVVGAAGALLAKGWHPSLGVRLDGDDLRSARIAPAAPAVERVLSSNRPVSAVPITLPEGNEQTSSTRRSSPRTRFVITGASTHVATFTPPAHLADALNTPSVGGQLKTVLTCYRDEESDTQGLAGTLVLELRANPAGGVESATLLPTSTVSDPHLRTCVIDAFTALRLPGAAITPEPMLWTVEFGMTTSKAD